MKEKGENKPKSSLTNVETMEVAKINSRLTSFLGGYGYKGVESK